MKKEKKERKRIMNDNILNKKEENNKRDMAKLQRMKTENGKERNKERKKERKKENQDYKL